jgi:hypothetical protein
MELNADRVPIGGRRPSNAPLQDLAPERNATIGGKRTWMRIGAHLGDVLIG